MLAQGGGGGGRGYARQPQATVGFQLLEKLGTPHLRLYACRSTAKFFLGAVGACSQSCTRSPPLLRCARSPLPPSDGCPMAKRAANLLLSRPMNTDLSPTAACASERGMWISSRRANPMVQPWQPPAPPALRSATHALRLGHCARGGDSKRAPLARRDAPRGPGMAVPSPFLRHAQRQIPLKRGLAMWPPPSLW